MKNPFWSIIIHSANYTRHIMPLLENSYIEYTIKENPKARNQKYIATFIGKSLLRK